MSDKLPLYFYNTLSKQKEIFTPLHGEEVRMYSCGPTIYDFVHIGNLRSFTFSDILRRTLTQNGYKVKQVMNMTDVGHIFGDLDTGEDKMVSAVQRHGKKVTLESLKEVADIYAEAFKQDIEKLNILPPLAHPRPSEHIPDQINLIKILEEKNYTYKTSDGVYFDIAQFPEYGKLGGIDIEALKPGSRIDLNPEKRNPQDFALWKFGEMGWDSPWGRGFPGWHIECSAMAISLLGEEIDIHTGGFDLIPTHHNNEIAQSEAATGKTFARFWMHGAFINIDGTKISKSLGNTFSLRDIEQKGYHPLTYRYLLLGAHYRSPMNFTWESLEGAQAALTRLHKYYFDELFEGENSIIGEPMYHQRFFEAINDDLDTPKALSILWELVKDTKVPKGEKRTTLLSFDTILGLGLENPELVQSIAEYNVIKLKDLPENIRLLVIAREEMRDEKNWAKSDELRDELKQKGYLVEDTSSGPRITNNN